MNHVSMLKLPISTSKSAPKMFAKVKYAIKVNAFPSNAAKNKLNETPH